jgi:hypothetical protein
MSPEVYTTFIIIVSLSVVGLVLCFFLLVVGTIGFIFVRVIRTSSVVDPQHPWAVIAKANNLTFTPGFLGFASGSEIVGEYHGYELRLEFIARNNINTTKLTLFEKDDTTASNLPAVYELTVHQPISFDDIIHLLAPNGFPDNLKGKIYTFYDGVGICYEQAGRETDIEYLQTLFDFIVNIADGYPKILSIGGEAVPVLEEMAKSTHPLHSVAHSLLKSIGKETEKRLSSKSSRLLCAYCFVYYAVHKVPFFWHSITYYGCRKCGQSNDFIDSKGSVVVVLDSKQELKQWKQAEKLCINWFAHEELFDFDQIEITRATDEDVERFAVRVGNDTDPVRKFRYKQMRCSIPVDGQLSDNTIRVLRKIFGQVEKQEIEELKR